MEFNLGKEIFDHTIEDFNSCNEIKGYVIVCAYEDGQVGYAWDSNKESFSSLLTTLEASKMRMIYNSSVVFEDIGNEDDD